MPDPFVFPAGASAAAFIMAVVGWYALLRTGVQLVHDDWKAASKYRQEIGNMMVDIKHQELGLQDWKKQWMISEHTPDNVLRTYWGDEELSIIRHKLRIIASEAQEVKLEMKKITALRAEQWEPMSAPKKKRRAKYIWTKRSYMRKLIENVPVSMEVVKNAADRGWASQQDRLYGGISNNSPYHTQISLLFVQIAKQTRQDLNSLRECTQALHEFSIELDLDLFDAIAAISKNAHSASVAAAAAAGHMKLDLLLRESHNPQAEMVRASVERSLEKTGGYARATDAFRSVITAQQTSTYYFALDASTVFSMCKAFRKSDPCSPARESLRQKISRNTPPTYTSTTNRLDPCRLVLGELSTFRLAYELSQVCLIFLRTTWISDICGCGLHCGGRHFPSTGRWYEFGLNMETTHQPPRWRNPYESSRTTSVIEGNMGDSWCMADSGWNAMTKPLRRLGLLLLEITLGTIVMKAHTDSYGSITHVVLLLRGRPPLFSRRTIRLEKALALVSNAVHGSDGFTDAVECCLTRVLDHLPFNDEWEVLLKNLYFDIVKP